MAAMASSMLMAVEEWLAVMVPMATLRTQVEDANTMAVPLWLSEQLSIFPGI
jgi:hypothetical protein